MKYFIFILTIIIEIFIVNQNNLYSQNCLKLVIVDEPESGFFNPDSIMVDSCQCGNQNIFACNEKYAKRWFFVFFPWEVIKNVPKSNDTDVFLNFNDIDSIYSNLRIKLQEMASKYGNFVMKKYYPHIVDSNSFASRFFVIQFDNYNLIDSVSNFLSSINDLEDSGFLKTYGKSYSNIDEPSFQFGGWSANVFLNRVIEFQAMKYSLMTNHFTIKDPMAWEITLGKKDIVICVVDQNFGNVSFQDYTFTDHQSYHIPNGIYNLKPGEKYYDYVNGPKQGIYTEASDWVELGHGVGCGLYQEECSGEQLDWVLVGDLFHKVFQKSSEIDAPFVLNTATENGNVLLFEEMTIDVGWFDGINRKVVLIDEYFEHPLQGSCKPQKIIKGHGSMCLSMAIGRLNGGGLMGVCPDCSAILNGAQTATLVYRTDTDPALGVQVPHVVTKSCFGHYGKDCLSKGINLNEVMIAHPTEGYHPTDLENLNFNNHNFYEESEEGSGYLKGTSFVDDIHEIFVDYCEAGNYFRSACLEWDPRFKNVSTWWDSYNTVNTLHYYSNIKFIELNSIPHKGGNPIDILAPSFGLGYDLNNKFVFYQGASPSGSLPHVAGAVGLMRTIDINLNSTTSQIHAKAYDIITFTAKKVLPTTPNLEFMMTWLPEWWDPFTNANDCYNFALNNYQYQPQYTNVQQKLWADPLKRYFSGNVAYGVLNTFRSVVHSIRNNGKSPEALLPVTYNNSDNLSTLFITGVGNINEKNQKLMHWGAYNQDGDMVLEYGGNKFNYEGIPEEEEDYDNCHGTTQITGVNTKITVPENCILAIDGILQQTPDDNTLYNCQVSTNVTSGIIKDGKILATGYLKDVELEGYIKLDDLKIYSTNTDGFGSINTFRTAPDVFNSSEIYGNVILFGNSKIEVGNDLTLDLVF